MLHTLALLIAVEGSVMVYSDHGGQLYDYFKQLEQFEQNNVPVEIAGICISACTIFLKVACVHPSAMLGFHGAAARDGNPIAEMFATRILADHYPPALQEWFYDNAAHLRRQEIAFLTGAAVIDLGAKECK